MQGDLHLWLHVGIVQGDLYPWLDVGTVGDGAVPATASNENDTQVLFAADSLTYDVRKEFVPVDEWADNRVVILMDGSGHAFRAAKMMLGGVPIARVESFLQVQYSSDTLFHDPSLVIVCLDPGQGNDWFVAEWL
jgi:hypothetical protein